MIHTADYHLREVYNEHDSQEDNLQLAITLNPSLELIIKAINQAQKEILQEAADVAKWKKVPPKMTNMYGCEIEIDKQSILKLINDIK